MADKMNVESRRSINRIQGMILKPSVDYALKSTIQIYQNTQSDRLKPLGTGVFLAIGDKHFFVTAAHVADDQKKWFLPVGEYEIVPAGNLECTKMPPSGKRDDDKIDLAVMQLNDPWQVSYLKQFHRFLNVGDLYTGRTPAEQWYLIVGYPASATKIFSGNVLPKPYPIATQGAANFNYQKKGFLSSRNFALMSSGKATAADNPLLQQAPNLQGISGGGLWLPGRPVVGGVMTSPRLAGIVIEDSESGNGKVLVATRTHVLIQFIEKGFGLSIR